MLCNDTIQSNDALNRKQNEYIIDPIEKLKPTWAVVTKYQSIFDALLSDRKVYLNENEPFLMQYENMDYFQQFYNSKSKFTLIGKMILQQSSLRNMGENQHMKNLIQLIQC